MSANSKTVCPISRSSFLTNAKAVEVAINGNPVVADVKVFSTGSFGWHHGDKVTIRVGNQLLKVQVGLTLTVVNSKDAPIDDPTPAAAA